MSESLDIFVIFRQLLFLHKRQFYQYQNFSFYFCFKANKMRGGSHLPEPFSDGLGLRRVPAAVSSECARRLSYDEADALLLNLNRPICTVPMSLRFQFQAKLSTCLSALALLLFAFLSACHEAPRKEEILVFAAISLKDVLNDLSREFESQHSGCKVVLNFGASGQLVQQVVQGADADLFVSAASKQINQLAAQQLISPDKVRICATSRLVVIAQEAKPTELSNLLELGKIAMGDPKSVPAGDYARQALEHAGIYEKLSSSSKIVFAENARQILTYVEGGDVDAGLVYNTDAMLARKSKVCFVIPQSYTKPMNYEIVVLKKSQHQKLSEEFMRLITGPDGQKSFRKRGFAA
jgi:molybdate transport system substrate-binding protein